MDEASIRNENHFRRTFCQIPFCKIKRNAERGDQSLDKLITFLEHKAKADRLANEELRNLLHSNEICTDTNLEEYEEYGTSIRKSIIELKSYVEMNCYQHLLLAKVLEDQVALPLRKLQEHTKSYRKTLQREISSVNENYAESYRQMMQANEELARVEKELQEAKDRQKRALHCIGIPAFELQRLAMRVSRCQEVYESAKMEHSRYKRALFGRIVARDEMGMAVAVAYQRAEEERIDQIKSSLERFVHVEKERMKAAHVQLESLKIHVENINQAEDIQLLIHNHSNPETMHFQGKALSILDWKRLRNQTDSDEDSNSEDERIGRIHGEYPNKKDSDKLSISETEPKKNDQMRTTVDPVAMREALKSFFEDDTASLEQACSTIEAMCMRKRGRTSFVKCLSHQRGFETRIKTQLVFDAMVRCFNTFLQECMHQNHVRAAKTAIILAETFYIAKQDLLNSNMNQHESSMESVKVSDAVDRSSETVESPRTNRVYLQVEVKQHVIWKSPKFWEKALLLAIGEELQRSSPSVSWECLPSGIPKSENVYTREEAVSHVHNIIFGQLGSFTLSMLEFGIPLAQIETFIETMCDANELTEEQRFQLRKSLREIRVALQ
uniref:Uncharacterized protein AlNc14C1G157 n=1 Tax=Albugo laibachii Nc14 TaxID=890382 RepID=F0VZ10_9STRA|nr:conserved hypothetical protein [Albugo laibachii Nc14]|eukprot:CCA14025.1 conserved hypothetical protein [Albugo laibachii Nc14]